MSIKSSLPRGAGARQYTDTSQGAQASSPMHAHGGICILKKQNYLTEAKKHEKRLLEMIEVIKTVDRERR